MTKLPVCQKAFILMHGISNKRLEIARNSLKNEGMFPNDKRGKHRNQAHKLSAETE